MSPPRPASAKKIPTCRSHDIRHRRQALLILQIFQRYGKAATPIRMLIGRPRQVDLVLYSEDVFHRDDQQARSRVREKSCHQGKIAALEAMLLQRMAQGLEGGATLLARLTGVDAQRLLDG